MDRDLEQAKQAIAYNLYAAVATVSETGEPWNSPVYVVFDDDLAFYWASAKDSQHSQNIAHNPSVFLSLYNSTMPWGKGQGVYVQARAEEVTDPEHITRICELRRARVPAASQPPEDFLGDRPRRLYRATVDKVWINKAATRHGHFVDSRVEIDVPTLRAALRGRGKARRDRFKLPAAASLMLLKDDRILLCRRYNTGWEDGKYGFMAGHIDGDESFQNALCREAKEELGITVAPDDITFVHAQHNRIGSEYMYMFFGTTTWIGEPKVCEPDKCDDVRWFALDDLPDKLVVGTNEIIDAMRRGRYYSEIGF